MKKLKELKELKGLGAGCGAGHWTLGHRAPGTGHWGNSEIYRQLS